MDFGTSIETDFLAGSQVHTGGMGQDAAENRANRRPKGAADSMDYRLLSMEIPGAANPNGGAEEKNGGSGHERTRT
jgi:hypothetical protein